MSFKPSSYSTLGAGSFDPYATSDARDPITLRDVPGGLFEVDTDGTITYKGGGPSSYPPIGRQWKKSHSNWETMIGNLAVASPKNKERLEAFLDPGVTSVAVQKAKEVAATQPLVSAKGSAGSALSRVKPKLHEHPAFWPGVAIGVAGIAGAVILLWPKKA